MVGGGRAEWEGRVAKPIFFIRVCTFNLSIDVTYKVVRHTLLHVGGTAIRTRDAAHERRRASV
jgi:hypothetical protein